MKGHLLILLANMLFGISVPIFKYLLLSGTPPEAISFLRTSCACIMFWIVSFFLPHEKVCPKDLLILMVCGLCGVGINQWMFVVGLKMTSPVDASIIATAVPILVLLLAALVLKEPITKKKSFGVFLGVCGGLTLVSSSSQVTDGASNLWGNTLILINHAMYSVYLVLSKPLSKQYASVTMMKWMFLFSTITLMPFCMQPVADVPTFHSVTFSMPQLCSLIYLLLGATFIAYMLIPMALKYIRPTTASMYNYVQPIIASLIAISIGQDEFSLSKLMSAVLIFIGVYLVTQSKKQNDCINNELKQKTL